MEESLLICHLNNVYKIKVTSEAPSSNSNLFDVIEPVVRAILYAEERGHFLSVIEIDGATVHCSKKCWKASENLLFTKYGKVLEAYPYMFILHVREKIATSVEIAPTQARSVQSSIGRDNVTESSGVLLNNRVIEPVVLLNRLKTTNVGDKSSQEKQHSGNEMSSGDNHGPKRSSSKQKTVSPVLPSTESKKAEKRNLIQDITISERSKLEPRKKRPKTSQTATKPREAKSLVENTSLASERSRSAKGKRGNNTVRGSHNCRAVASAEDSRLGRLRDGGRVPLILPQRRDRHVIEQEQIAEDMKLQTLARTNSPSAPEKPKTSGLWKFVETILTPVKLFTSRRKTN